MNYEQWEFALVHLKMTECKQTNMKQFVRLFNIVCNANCPELILLVCNFVCLRLRERFAGGGGGGGMARDNSLVGGYRMSE